MAKKIFSCILFFILCSLYVQAQNNSFSIKITKVYPEGGVVDGDTYNLSGELDKAEAKFRSLYTGRDANYIMELTKPSGKETKYIQNINWILIENGTKKGLKSKPILQPFYSQPTIIEYYNCDIRGKKKDSASKFNYEYFYRFYKGKDMIENNNEYRTIEECKKTADEYFTKNKVDTILCNIEIYNYNSKGVVKDSTNQKGYNEYKEKQKIADSIRMNKTRKIADSIRVNTTKTMAEPQKEITENKGKIDTIDNKENIKKQLEQLQTEANSLKKGEKDFRQKMNKIIEDADKIIEMMKIDPKNFNRNKYFESDLENLKKGIKELIKINNKQKK
jgi:hypothetical protein